MSSPSTTSRHFTYYVEQGVQVVVLTMENLLGEELANTLSEELLALADSLAAPRIVVDFRNVKSISGAGLRPLLNLRRRVRERNGQLLLCALREDVADVFIATHLVSATQSTAIPFAIAPDVGRAVAHLSKKAPGK